jgi:SAM-dependent methyltransferase
MSEDARWVGSMPEIYDRVLGPVLFAPFAERLAATASRFTPRSVLELAAGTGVATAALVRALPGARIVATDLNPAMVAWATQRVPGATWQQADAQHLDLPDSTFDMVVCQFGVMFFPDRSTAYAEAARVLTPGATLLFSVWDTIDTSDFPRVLMESVSAVLPENSPSFVTRVPHGYADPQLIQDELAAAGLIDIDVERVVLTGSAPSAALLAEGFCQGTPLRFALEERGSLPDLTAAVAHEMTLRLGAGEVVGDLAAFQVTARTPA